MDDKEFVEEFYFLKNELIAGYKPKEATGFRKELVDKLVSNSEQAEALDTLLETIMTDALYTVLLGLDGSAAIGGLQIDYKLHDEDGNELTGKNITGYAGEFFHEND